MNGTSCLVSQSFLGFKSFSDQMHQFESKSLPPFFFSLSFKSRSDINDLVPYFIKRIDFIIRSLVSSSIQPSSILLHPCLFHVNNQTINQWS